MTDITAREWAEKAAGSSSIDLTVAYALTAIALAMTRPRHESKPKPPVETTPPPKGEHRLSSIADAAAYYGCEHKLIRRLIASGTLKGYRIPGTKLIRVDLDELDTLAGGAR